MRVVPLILVAPLCVAGSLLARTQVVTVQPKSPGKAASADIHETFTGTAYGETQDDAIELARSKAQRQAIDHFVMQRPPLIWDGTEDYIRKHMTDVGSTVEVKTAEKIPEATVKVEVNLTNAEYRELIQKDRQHRSVERHGIILPIFLVLVVLLGAAGVYHRIDEAKHGRFSRWLRGGAVAVIGAAGIGIWLLVTS